MKYYKISEERLKKLLYADYRLDCLEVNGVDNWPGYMDNKISYINEAFGIYDEDVSLINEEDKIGVKLSGYLEVNESTIFKLLLKYVDKDNVKKER